MQYPSYGNPYQSGGFPPSFRQYPTPPQNYQPQQPNTPQIPVFQVSSIDEAKAQIPNPLVPTMFCNFGQNEIYVKYVDNNGQGRFHTFRLIEDVTPEPEAPWQGLSQRLDNIEQILGSIANVQSSEPSADAKSSVPATAKPNVATTASISGKSTSNAVGKV